VSRLAIVAALEALEAGDQAYAVEILLAALEDGPVVYRCECQHCGARFEWAGLLDRHLIDCRAAWEAAA
jgi:hypothetical protein